MDKKLLEQIARIRLISNYRPGLTLNEQTPSGETTAGEFVKIEGNIFDIVEGKMSKDLGDFVDDKIKEYLKNIKVEIVQYTPDVFKIWVDENYLGETVYDKNNRYAVLDLRDKKYTRQTSDDYGNPTVGTFLGWEVSKYKVNNLYDDFIKAYPKYSYLFQGKYTELYVANGLSISQCIINSINGHEIPIIIKKNSETNERDDKNMSSLYFGIYARNMKKISPKNWKELETDNKSVITIDDELISSTKGNVYNLFYGNGIYLVTGGSNRKNPITIKVQQAKIPEAINLALVLPVEYKGDDTPPPPLKCYCNDIKTGEQIEYPCDDELPERCKDDGDPIVFDFVVETKDNFVFDQAELTQEAIGKINEQIVEEWNEITQNRKEEYLEFLKDKTINVNSYASIDALSNYRVTGGYSPCRKSGQLRKVYNKCLSQARAEAVVEYLKTIADGAFKNVNFVANGMGETNQFSGLKWDNEANSKTDINSPHSTDDTKSDRRFEVKFPAYHKED